MDLATVVGLAGGTGLIIVVMQIAGSLLMFWDLTSLIVVLGGAAFGALIQFPLESFIGGLSAASKAIFNQVENPNDLIEELTNLANTARKESILALEKAVIQNKYLAKGVKFAVDGYDPAVIDSILVADTTSMKKRHQDGRAIFEKLGELCPAFGMIGTVIGLVVIMANISDPSAIGPGLAVALVTTLYGALFANLYFTPMSAKMKYRSNQELINMEIIRAGIDAMLAGENPRAMREKLEAFVA